MDYRKEIDGLRALAVLPVVLFHAGFLLFSGGFVGVDVFFVISGYLITSIIISEQQAGNFSLLHFYERRARRILPALVVVVLACLPAAWFWLLPSDLKEFSESVVSVFTFSSNFLFWRTSGYFDSDTELKPLLHTWSLAVEEQYYLFFPLVVGVFWRFGQTTILLLLAATAAFSLGLAQWGSIHDPTAAFYLLPTRGWELLIGAGTAFVLSHSPRRPVARLVNEFGSLVGLLLIAGPIFLYSKATPFPGVYALAPTAGAALIILCATQETVVGRMLGSPVPLWIGLVSYSTYLWHQPLFAFARLVVEPAPGAALMLLLSAASLLLGYLSWRYVERPFRNRHVMSRRAVFSLGGGASLAFVLLGAAGIVTTGFAYRYDAPDRYLATLQKRVAGKYVSKRFNERLMKPFVAADGRRRILIIGDSFAQDLVNAIAASAVGRDIQMSTRHIGHECGDLFIEQAIVSSKIRDEFQHDCAGKGLFDDAELRKLMLAADEVWFAARWQLWQASMIPQSLANVVAYTSKPVRVFGRKDFGSVSVKALLATPKAARWATVNPVNPETGKINAALRAGMQSGVFIDIQQLLCAPAIDACRLFTDAGDLISYDGGHLTEKGADYLGSKLAQHNSLTAGAAH